MRAFLFVIYSETRIKTDGKTAKVRSDFSLFFGGITIIFNDQRLFSYNEPILIFIRSLL